MSRKVHKPKMGHPWKNGGKRGKEINDMLKKSAKAFDNTSYFCRAGIAGQAKVIARPTNRTRLSAQRASAFKDFVVEP